MGPILVIYKEMQNPLYGQKLRENIWMSQMWTKVTVFCYNGEKCDNPLHKNNFQKIMYNSIFFNSLIPSTLIVFCCE